MTRNRLFCTKLLVLFFILIQGSVCLADQKATELVKKTWHYMRGNSSISELKMTIKHPAFTRTYTIKSWTRGLKDSVFFITSPPKDAGNGTLKLGQKMCIYNPKVGGIIMLPPSMMSQSWMGSDFSNNDLAKADTILTDYTHSIEKVETIDGKKIYYIKCIPFPNAPVVWGMQKLVVREDYIILKETFYDDEEKPVKTLTSKNIQKIGNKLFPMFWTMKVSESPDTYTVIEYKDIIFDKALPDRYFTQTYLQNPQI